MVNDLDPLNEFRRQLGEQPAITPAGRAGARKANTSAPHRARRATLRGTLAALSVLTIVTAHAEAAHELWLAAAGAGAGVLCFFWRKRH
jgi:hypothetical protein